MAASLEFSGLKTGRRRTTSKLPSVTPQLKEVELLPNEELEEKWHQMFFDIYIEADKERKNGNHKDALVSYRNAQVLINAVKERGINDSLILVREALLHYAIIQSYSNIQMEPDMVMREFHNFGEVLFDFVVLILKDEEDQQEVLKKIQESYIQDHYVNVNYLFDTVKSYFNKQKQQLGPEKLELIWRCAYFLTRFTGSIHDFFLRSTDLTAEGQKYHENCKEAAAISIEAMNLLPQGYIPDQAIDVSEENKDPEKYQKAARYTLKDQTETWLDVYTDFLEVEIEHILGNDKPAKILLRKRKIEKLKNRANQVLQKFKNGEFTHPANVEFALEVKVQTTFDDLIKNRIDYNMAKGVFNEMLKEAIDQEFKRVQTLIQILVARAAVRFEKIEEATAACDEIRILRGKTQTYYRGSMHIYDKWLNVIQAEIQLLESSSRAGIDQERQETSEKVDKVTNFDSQKLTKHLTLDDIDKIEEIFDAYRLDTDSPRPKLSNRAMDAKIYYILGKTAFAKIRLLGAEYSRIKEKKNGEKFNRGPELLKAFMDCQKYLCEAYNNLKDVGFKGTRLFRLIQRKYKEMMYFNDELLNDFRKPKDPEEKEQQNDEFDMAEIASDYRIQKWTDMVYRILRNRDLANSEDYEGVLNHSVGASLREIVPTIGRTYMYEERPDGVKIIGHVDKSEYILLDESIENYKNNKKRTYLYHTNNGRILRVMPVDEQKGRYMILEVDMKMSKASEEIIEEIFKGMRYLLNLNDIMNEMEALDAEDPAYKTKKKEALEEMKALTKYLFRRHNPTMGHQEEMAFMCSQIGYYLNETKNCNIDPVIAEAAGMLHDVGKLSVNTIMLLDIPRRYQDFEREETEKHAIEGPEFLRGIPHFIKNFPELATLIFSHHVKYGLEPSYPVEAPGDKIKELPRMLLDKLENPTEEEIKALSFELSEDYIWMARMMNPADQIQAVRSTDRKYRAQGPMPLKDLNGYLMRKAGTDFHPEAVIVIIEMLKRGLIGKTITYSDDEIRQLRDFKTPNRIYSCLEIFEFAEQKQHELERECQIPLNVFLMELGFGVECNLLMTEQMLGRKLCDYYIQQEGGDKKAGITRFDALGSTFFKELWEYLGSKEVTAE